MGLLLWATPFTLQVIWSIVNIKMLIWAALTVILQSSSCFVDGIVAKHLFSLHFWSVTYKDSAFVAVGLTSVLQSFTDSPSKTMCKQLPCWSVFKQGTQSVPAPTSNSSCPCPQSSLWTVPRDQKKNFYIITFMITTQQTVLYKAMPESV